MSDSLSNIILIGMAGSGKSTIGPLLALALSRNFIDTDTLIEKMEQSPLQDIIDTQGPMGFRRIEEEVLLALDLRHHVIATGGSSIYSHAGMTHLKKQGLVVFLDVDFDVLESRVCNLDSRGLVKLPEQGFADLFSERLPLYGKYADIRIACADLSEAQICEKIIQVLGER